MKGSSFGLVKIYEFKAVFFGQISVSEGGEDIGSYAGPTAFADSNFGFSMDFAIIINRFSSLNACSDRRR
jgi:hypothetical protein